MSGILDFLWETTIQSTVLFAAIAALRWALRGRIKPGLQYALWGLLLFRLLIPVPIQSPFSVMNAVHPATAAVRQFAYPPATSLPQATTGAVVPSAPAAPFGWPQALLLVWLAGVVISACCMFAVNVRFHRRAMREARPLRLSREYVNALRLTGIPRGIPLYVSDGVPSPCLMGLVRPKVLLTPEAAKMPDRLRHILLHELSHWWQRDNWIALLRNAACALHWFNPFVWAAAILSRRDCEMACDARALKHLDAGENLTYGETLVRLIRSRPSANRLNAATTMAAGKREMKERLNLIVRQPRVLATATAGAVLVAITLAAAACTGAVREGKPGSSVSPGHPTPSYTAQAMAPSAQPTATTERSPSPSIPPQSASTDSTASQTAPAGTAETTSNQGVKLWEQGEWAYWLQTRDGEDVETKDGKSSPLGHRLGRLYRTNGDSRQIIDEFVDFHDGAWTVLPAMDRIVMLGYSGEKYTELKGSPSIVSVNRDGTDKKVFAPKFNMARSLCMDGKFIYYEGWTNNGAFPRPINRITYDMTGSMKMADIQGWLITVKDGYAYYVNKKGYQVYRLRMDWKSKPELYLDDFNFGALQSVQQTGENEYLLTNDKGMTKTLEIESR